MIDSSLISFLVSSNFIVNGFSSLFNVFVSSILCLAFSCFSLIFLFSNAICNSYSSSVRAASRISLPSSIIISFKTLCHTLAVSITFISISVILAIYSSICFWLLPSLSIILANFIGSSSFNINLSLFFFSCSSFLDCPGLILCLISCLEPVFSILIWWMML